MRACYKKYKLAVEQEIAAIKDEIGRLDQNLLYMEEKDLRVFYIEKEKERLNNLLKSRYGVDIVKTLKVEYVRAE